MADKEEDKYEVLEKIGKSVSSTAHTLSYQTRRFVGRD